MSNSKRGRLIAAVIILVGAILLIAGLIMPWYTYKTSSSGLSETINFYPGMPSTNGTIQYQCSGIPTCPPQTSYSARDLNNTGMVAETGFYLLIVGIILGVIAAILGVASRGNPRRANGAVPLAVVALILALVAPVLFVVALPPAIGKDTPNHPANGPWSSFIGSNSTTEFGISVTTSWGPAVGWYLAIASFVILLVGVVLLARYRREPPQAVTASASAPPAAVTQTPPISPPGR